MNPFQVRKLCKHLLALSNLYGKKSFVDWPIRAVREWHVPTSQDDVRSFLGLAGYYHRFVPGYGRIAAPLHGLLGPAVKKRNRRRLMREDSWQGKGTSECEAAFNQLKEKLVFAPILGYPDFTKPFILETHASFKGLGAVLS